VFEDAWDAFGQSADPTLFYGAYGVTYYKNSPVGTGGLVAGMSNGDPGNWEVEGTNGTSAWGLWYGDFSITFDETVMDVSLDFIRAGSDQAFTVEAYSRGAKVDSRAISVVGAWDFDTVFFPGPLDQIVWAFPASFMAVDDLRYSAPTLPCPSRVVDETPTTGSFAGDVAPGWANKGYEFRARETFDITGGAYWINIPTDGIVRLSIYDTGGVRLATGSTARGLGIERWYHSELNFTFNAGSSYVASFYTNRASTGLFDRQTSAALPFDVDALIDIVAGLAGGAGDDVAEAFPTSNNTWYPFQRLVRDVEVVENRGFKSGSGDFSCPANWRLPNYGEYGTVDDFLTAGDVATIDYNQNIAVMPPAGCACKWNATFCGQPSIETYDGRMCGDFSQLHMCVEDR
jgi:hypothetical protein